MDPLKSPRVTSLSAGNWSQFAVFWFSLISVSLSLSLSFFFFFQ